MLTAPSVDMTGNLSIDGALTTIGDAPTDTVDFNTNISQDFEPGSTEGLTLGTGVNRWKELHTKTANINSISISSQTIATNESNADLYITAKGTGKVRVENLEFEDNKIIGKFSPEGEFIVTDYELSTPDIFNGNQGFKTQLPRYTTVFGIPVLGTANVSDLAIKHAANMLASYLDNNFDGVADNTALLATFSSGLYGIVVYADASEETTLASTFGSFAVNRTFGVYQKRNE